ncbi:hypothetical protein PM082_011197 [Marasmius tenuissimus]|nr:hypothetical protein PM082_011197 [Marasmius tenuissimus]
MDGCHQEGAQTEAERWKWGTKRTLRHEIQDEALWITVPVTQGRIFKNIHWVYSPTEFTYRQLMPTIYFIERNRTSEFTGVGGGRTRVKSTSSDEVEVTRGHRIVRNTRTGVIFDYRSERQKLSQATDNGVVDGLGACEEKAWLGTE